MWIPIAAPIRRDHTFVIPDAALPGQAQVDTDASFQDLFLYGPQPMWVYALATLQFLEVNNAAVQQYGYSRAEFLDRTITSVLEQDLNGSELIDARARTGLPPNDESRHRLKDGRMIDVEVASRDLTFHGLEARMMIVRDITARKGKEVERKESEQKYRLIYEDLIAGIYQSTPDGHLLSVNPAMAQMFGFDSPGAMLVSITDIEAQLYVDPARRSEFKQHMREHGFVERFEVQLYRKDRSTMWISMNARAIREDDGVVHYKGSFEEITERKLLEDALRQTHHEYSDLRDKAVIGVFQSTPEGRYISANPAMAKMLGYATPKELMAQVTDIVAQVYAGFKSWAEIKILISGRNEVKNLEFEAYRKDGSKIWLCSNLRAVLCDGTIVRYEGTCEDVTRRRSLEDQLRQAQKMEAVGQLAGGVAHDFNNALGVITGYSDLLLTTLPKGDASHKYAGEILKAGRRAATLTRQLLAFSRKQVIQPIVLDLNTATEEFEKMFCRLIGEDIAVTFLRGLGLGPVKMDPGQVEQILMNLVLNSRDAMPHGGRLSIETSNVELDDTFACQHAFVHPGSYVMLSISDTGCGMSKETIPRIFEPFFTTKKPGKGTGLGLSTVYGIMKQNGGYVVAYSELGKGTTFRLYLPRLGNDVALSQPTAAPDAVLHGTETVLVVEDEEPLRNLVRICLGGHGYSVLDAPDAAAALALAKGYPGRIHLLLTDVVMPGMSGRKLAKRLMAIQPKLKVVYMSGYTGDLIDHHGILGGVTVLLEKPFTLRALLTKTSHALHSSENGKSAAAL
jgi:two-component system cell cycle sensor histidine kinase/response regulator CckA